MHARQPGRDTGTEIKKRQGREGDRKRQSETERESEGDRERQREQETERDGEIILRLY